jgi:hypothetical protein
VVGLTFLFGFGNVLALGLRLGVPVWVAPLVAPAVDLSVVALLLATRHLALHSGPVEVLRPARRLLLFSSVVTLALNIADPVITGRYGKAAFDAVGPLLLIGWAEVGPMLLHAMQQDTAVALDTSTAYAEQNGGAGWSTASAPSRAPAVRAARPRTTTGEADVGGLLERARAEDAEHWRTHRRPISAETLRKRLHVGAVTSRALVTRIRAGAPNHLALAQTRDAPAQPPPRR